MPLDVKMTDMLSQKYIQYFDGIKINPNVLWTET